MINTENLVSGINKSKLNNLVDVIKQNPQNRDSYLNLAIELSLTSRYDEAIKAFCKANTLKEDYITLYNIGSLYYKKNDYKNAILVLEKIKSLNKKFHMAFLLTGICYGRLNNFKAAESNFINVIMTDPDNTIALTALSILYYNQGKIDESVKILAKLKDSKINTVVKIKNEILHKTGKISESEFKIRNKNSCDEGFKKFDEFIRSVPVDILTDKFGTIEDKIRKLESTPVKNRNNLISLSLCHLFSGNTDSAMNYLIEAGNNIAV